MAENFRLRYNHNAPKNHQSGMPNPKANLVVLGVFLAIGVLFLFPLFPPFGLAWSAAIGSALFKELKIQGILKKDVEGKYRVDQNKAKSAGKRSFEEVRAYTKDTAKKVKTHVSESDRMEEHQPYEHPHTPVNYSYDSCAQERRLEQLKSLKDAGILDEKEYKERRERVMQGK